MRLLIIVLATLLLLLLSSCSTDSINSGKTKPKDDSTIGLRFAEKVAYYKHGSQKDLMQIIYSSISGLSMEGYKNTKGVYEINISSLGAVSGFRVMRSITDDIDSKIESICDTLEFYPAEYNGIAMKSKLTLPIQLEFK